MTGLWGAVAGALAEIGDGPTLAALGVASVFAGLARGFSGFGTALVFMPVAAALTAPATALVAFLTFDLIGGLSLLPWGARRCRRGEVALLLGGILVGAPLGVWLLATLDALTLRWTVCLLALAAGILMAAGWRWRGPTPAWSAAPVGAAAGFAGGVAGLTGVPVVLFYIGRAGGAERLRANIIVMFFFATIANLALLGGRGLATPAAVTLGLTLTPVFLLGVLAGRRVYPLASEAVFRRVAYAMIFASVLLGLPLFDGAAG